MNDKKLVAECAVKEVSDGMVVGLGTGSTANYFIEALAKRRSAENLQITCVASSVVSLLKAQSLALPMIAIEHLIELDLYVDGADEVAPDHTLLKGQGSDLVKEKILARACDQFIVLIDASKQVQFIGESRPIPVEVMPFSWQLVQKSLKAFGGKGELRKSANGLAITSYGSLVLDVSFDLMPDPAELDRLLNAIPGVIEHGVFCDLASQILISEQGIVQEISI